MVGKLHAACRFLAEAGEGGWPAEDKDIRCLCQVSFPLPLPPTFSLLVPLTT